MKSVDTSLRSAVAVYTDTPPVLDGAIDDLVWKSAPWTDDFIRSDGQARAPRRCRAKFLWTDEALYVAFEVEDEDLIAPYLRRDEPLYTKDVVELFIDPDGDGKDYYEFEVSPRGTLFDARFPSHRKHLKRSMKFNAESFEAAVDVQGTLDDDTPDEGYTVEFKIEFADIDRAPRSPPHAGDVWRVNLFRIDHHADGADYTAWTAPMVGDFHALDRFGELAFRR